MKINVVLLLLIICPNIAVALKPSTNDSLNFAALMNMSLEDIQKLKVITASSLATTSVESSPSTVTIITQEDIQLSGGRRLTDILEIFVPNYQFINQDVIPWQHGSRGIMSNDKQLLLVNGRNTIHRTSNGIQSEMDLPGLSDIKLIEVIRGPGSATHGPGALGMVINIVTYDYKSFKGAQLKAKVGGIENYQSAEVMVGHSINANHGFYGYINVSASQGASPESAPLYMGRTDNDSIYDPNDNMIEYGKYYRKQAYEKQPRFKTHLQYNNKGVEIWLRHMSGGEAHNTVQKEIEKTGYGHTNFNAIYKLSTGKNHTLEFITGWDNFWLRRSQLGNNSLFTVTKSYREMEHNGKIYSKWDFDADDLFFGKELFLTVGGEIRHDQLGLPHYDLTLMDSRPQVDSIIDAPWNTTVLSLIGEFNYKLNNQIRFIAGGRYDKHTYTDHLFSPRVSLIYSPNEKNTLKLIFAQSLRLTAATELQIDHNMNSAMLSDVEELISYELRTEHFLSPNIHFGGNIFYHNWEPVGFNHDKNYRTKAGNIRSAGIDIEGNYKNRVIRFRASHSFTKLLNWNKIDELKQYESKGHLYHYSTADNGIGNDFSYWHNHNTKLSCFFYATPKLTVTGSTNILWGSPGGYNFALTARDSTIRKGNNPENYTLPDDKPFQESVYINLGTHYKFTNKLSMAIDLHNVAGLFNEKWNKRWIWTNVSSPGNHIIQPPSFSISVAYKH